MYKKRLKVFDEVESLGDETLAEFYKFSININSDYDNLYPDEKQKLAEVAGLSERAQGFLYNLCFEDTTSYDIVKSLKKSNSGRGYVSELSRTLKLNKGTLYPLIRELLERRFIVVDPYCGGERHTVYKSSGIAEEDGFDSLWDRLTEIAGST